MLIDNIIQHIDLRFLMARFLMTILILFMAAGPMLHGYLAYKLNAVQTLVAEEETHDDKPQGKDKPDNGKDKYYSSAHLHNHLTADLLRLSSLQRQILLSKGFTGILYQPPEVI